MTCPHDRTEPCADGDLDRPDELWAMGRRCLDCGEVTRYRIAAPSAWGPRWVLLAFLCLATAILALSALAGTPC